MFRGCLAAGAIAAVVGLGLLPAMPAHAVDIVNEDEAQYLVTIVATEGEMDTVIDGMASLYEVCARCVIRIDGIGDVRADEDASVVVIKDRRASVEL